MTPEMAELILSSVTDGTETAAETPPPATPSPAVPQAPPRPRSVPLTPAQNIEAHKLRQLGMVPGSWNITQIRAVLEEPPDSVTMARLELLQLDESKRAVRRSIADMRYMLNHGHRKRISRMKYPADYQDTPLTAEELSGCAMTIAKLTRELSEISRQILEVSPATATSTNVRRPLNKPPPIPSQMMQVNVGAGASISIGPPATAQSGSFPVSGSRGDSP